MHLHISSSFIHTPREESNAKVRDHNPADIRIFHRLTLLERKIVRFLSTEQHPKAAFYEDWRDMLDVEKLGTHPAPVTGKRKTRGTS